MDRHVAPIRGWAIVTSAHPPSFQSRPSELPDAAYFVLSVLRKCCYCPSERPLTAMGGLTVAVSSLTAYPDRDSATATYL
jgi:hypothetical protein